MTAAATSQLPGRRHMKTLALAVCRRTNDPNRAVDAFVRVAQEVASSSTSGIG